MADTVTIPKKDFEKMVKAIRGAKVLLAALAPTLKTLEKVVEPED